MMKKFLSFIIVTIFFTSCDILSQMGMPLTELDVANGLKQALTQGVNLAGRSLFQQQSNGNTALLNQLMPGEITQVMNVARTLGLSPQIDKLNSNLNTAAVNSVQRAVPIFVQSIATMNINDAFSILRGDQNAATNFLRRTASTALSAAIQPEVNNVFASVGVKPTLMQNLGVNNPLLSGFDVNLSQLLSNMVVDQIFTTVAQEEKRIRTDVGARSTVLLQRVFAAATQPATM